jgi:hypothetical protein
VVFPEAVDAFEGDKKIHEDGQGLPGEEEYKAPQTGENLAQKSRGDKRGSLA